MLQLKIFIKSVLLFFYKPFYKKKCPVCNRKVFKFLPLPSFYQEAAKKHNFPYLPEDTETLNYDEYSCPFCGASDRDRLYALFFNRTVNSLKKYTLLDIAPAPALRSFLKRKENIIYRSADLFQDDVDDKGVDITKMDLYKDNSFDFFICSHVLEHVPDDTKGMAELRRVLKADGYGIAMVPIVLTVQTIDEDPSLTDVDERWRRFGQDDHVRLYSKHGFTKRLHNAGFIIKEFTVDDFGSKVFNRYGISKKSVLYIVSK